MLPFFAAFLVLIFNQLWLASVGMLSSVILVSVQGFRWSVSKKNCQSREWIFYVPRKPPWRINTLFLGLNI